MLPTKKRLSGTLCFVVTRTGEQAVHPLLKPATYATVIFFSSAWLWQQSLYYGTFPSSVLRVAVISHNLLGRVLSNFSCLPWAIRPAVFMSAWLCQQSWSVCGINYDLWTYHMDFFQIFGVASAGPYAGTCVCVFFLFFFEFLKKKMFCFFYFYFFFTSIFRFR